MEHHVIHDRFYEMTRCVSSTMTFYHGKNSPACKKSGYPGRVGLFGLMEMTDTVRRLVVTKARRRSQGDSGS